MFRLQLGFDKKTVDAGILMLPSNRGEKSPYGTTAQIVTTEIKMINQSITVPVCIALFEVKNLNIPIEDPEISEKDLNEMS